MGEGGGVKECLEISQKVIHRNKSIHSVDLNN